MKQIFIVEDDEGIRELIELLLNDQGYKVMAFPSAEKFHEKIQAQTPDLILLDIRLPDGDGRKICRILRQEDRTRNIPIILTSADAIPVKTDGADDFIPKPFDIDDFLLRIEKHLSSQPM